MLVRGSVVHLGTLEDEFAPVASLEGDDPDQLPPHGPEVVKFIRVDGLACELEATWSASTAFSASTAKAGGPEFDYQVFPFLHDEHRRGGPVCLAVTDRFVQGVVVISTSGSFGYLE